jgi:hypothetical protein
LPNFLLTFLAFLIFLNKDKFVFIAEVIDLENICLNLPDKLLALGGSTEKIAQDMRNLYILDMVRKKVISANYGAEILGLHLTEFVQVMSEYGLPYFSELPQASQEIDRLFEKASGI